MKKVYLVQTWKEDGSLKDHYEVSIEGTRELGALRAFLKKSSAHVLITRQPEPKKTVSKRR